MDNARPAIYHLSVIFEKLLNNVMVRLTCGRPKSFDKEIALEKALDVFWTQGYDGASLKDLTQAMGINKPSMYATFGNKEQLYFQAVEMYKNREGAPFFSALEQPQIRDVIETIFSRTAEAKCSNEKNKGCLMIQSSLACSDESSVVKISALKMRVEFIQLIQNRFERAANDGQLVQNADIQVMTHYAVTMLDGLQIHSIDNPPPEMLESVAKIAAEHLFQFCLPLSSQ
ncbi:TetR/AcrR family transcriptional regulator [Vibrio tubiashii]|uniref:TetR/AcrR family transcriptional regulator n=1 Tax=Vibrio tubiashii TaxID=29498 RepID=UPI00234E5BDC|nr:TetR/AcrR family transcriptional regulator [Vibrio tubiashii]WCP67761.1 TetR/AcrR family transcriptional regulator [Vibrio tubiashii]